MLVRCERCRAAFAVPDALRGRQGLQVECGRCLFVFEPRFEKDRDEPALAVRAVAPTRRSRLTGWRTALAALGVLAILGGGLARYWRTRPPRLTKAAAARIKQGEALLLRDDLESLEGAAQLFTEAAHLAPRVALPEAQRALALLLQASTRQALRDPAATSLLQQGTAAARTALAESPRDPAALRAMALAQALAGAPAEAAPLVAAAAGDPWTAYVRAVADPPGALAALQAALQAEPRLLRAEVDEARLLQAASPQRAKELLAHVLRENPRHELAQRLAK